MVAESGAEIEELPDSVQTVNKLMAAIERLRGERDAVRNERDELQRDFDFLKAESKFTIESLRKKDAVASSNTSSLAEVSPGPADQHLQRAFTVSILVAQHLQVQQELESTHRDRLFKDLSRSQEMLSESRRSVLEKEAFVKRIQREDNAMRDALTTAEVKLASSETRVVDLTSLTTRLEEEITQERTAHEELGLALAQTEAQLSDANKALENVESQRSSLALQVSHLEQDLDAVKAELLDAETRYSTLQAQQLSSMSSSAASRALKEQIEELEGRVMRRTEQIGIHQHDIKRLETNLRLQEERVDEMTAELAVAEAEKKAMVEDCSNTREERDEARKRCEQLEEDIEMADESRGIELQALVTVIAKAVVDRRAVSTQLEHSRAAHLSLSGALEQAQQSREDMAVEAEELHAEHESTRVVLAETTSQLQISKEELRGASNEAQQATVALATLYQDLRGTTAALHDAQDSRMSIEQQFQVVRSELQTKLNELSALRVQYEALRSREEEHCLDLQRAEEDVQNKYQQALSDLEAAKEEARVHMSDSTEHLQEEETLKQQLEETQRRFGAETTELREELTTTRGQLEQARLDQAGAESEYRQALQDAENARKELQQSLDETVEKLEARAKIAGDLETLQVRYEEEVEALKDRLRDAERELEDLRKTRDEHVAEHAKVAEDLEQKQEELSHILTEKEAVDAELAEVKMRLEAEAKILESRLESLERERDELKQKCDDMEVRSDQVSSGRDDLEEQLQKATTDADLLRLELKSEMEGRQQQAAADAEALERAKERAEQAEASCLELKAQESALQAKLDETESALQTAKVQIGDASQLQERLVHLQSQLNETEVTLRDTEEQAKKASCEYSDLQQEVVVLRSKLEDAEVAFNALHEEEQRLHTELTPLQAEIQKLLSERRFLESKLQGSETETAALKKQLEDTRATQVQWEKAAKSAEVKLDLQVAQHNKTVESLRKELAGLQDLTKLEDTVADLQERNVEMEELLKSKCQEIEENDDRFIKFLKDEKKLTSKVEFLTRKVKTLQDKLTAASSSDSTPKGFPLPTASTSSNPGPSHPHVSHPPAPRRSIPTLPAMPDFSAVASSSRTRTSSAASRQLSPEERIPPPVFRARTPEDKQMPSLPMHSHAPPPLQEGFSMSNSGSSTSIGKKRRAPDDFEDCDSVPPQMFTADSVPHGEGATTPRIRRALQNVRSGFTPVRHVRPAVGQGSPSRRTTTGAAIIADVTNSPRSKSSQAGKRGWLGKIKGSSGHAPRPMTSSRPRPQNAGP